MSEIYLTRGDVIQMDKKWLILDIMGDSCLLILLETKRTKIKVASIEEIHHLIDTFDAELCIYEKKDKNIIPFMNKESAALIHERNRRMAEDILHHSNSLFWLSERKERAEFIEKTAEHYDVSTDTVRRFLRDYLQNNLSLHGIVCKYSNCGGKGKRKHYVSGKRPGRSGVSKIVRDDVILDQFETILNRAIKSGCRMTTTAMYQDLCEMYYSAEEIVDGSVVRVPYAAVYRPTIRQLSYYIRTNLTDEERYISRFGLRQARNNIRPLHSDTIADLDVKTIGARYEVDEVEADFTLVDRVDRSHVIGRPIVYFAVDVFSKMIVGVATGLDNNSWPGAELLFLNMAEDKVEFCKKAGIEIKSEEWPVVGVLPNMIQTDNGSEYLSKCMEKFARETGTIVASVPPGMGSYKPNVEQMFHQFNLKTKSKIPGEIIKGDYSQSHLRTAILTIEEFHKIVIEFILYHNRTPMTKYPMTTEMLKDQLIPSPINIWNWKMTQETSLRKILNFNQYKYSLLKEDNARITREGISYRNVLYTCEDIEWLGKQMVDAGLSTSKTLPIRYDVRNMNIIYFEANGSIIKGWINDKKAQNDVYTNLTSIELDNINQFIRNQKKQIEEIRLAEGIKLNGKFSEIVKDARKKHSGRNNVKDIREHRRVEKEKLHSEAQVVIDTEVSVKPAKLVTEKPKLGKAPTAIKYEGVSMAKLPFTEVIKIQKQIDYEVNELGYSPE